MRVAVFIHTGQEATHPALYSQKGAKPLVSQKGRLPPKYLHFFKTVIIGSSMARFGTLFLLVQF